MTQNEAVSYKSAMGCFCSSSCIKQNAPLGCIGINELFTPIPEVHLSKIALPLSEML